MAAAQEKNKKEYARQTATATKEGIEALSVSVGRTVCSGTDRPDRETTEKKPTASLQSSDKTAIFNHVVSSRKRQL